LGKIAPIDISDVCGMNLWNIRRQQWSHSLLEIVGGNAADLESKLGKVEVHGGEQLGLISTYFVCRYQFPKRSITRVSG
jgi:xylulokinase